MVYIAAAAPIILTSPNTWKIMALIFPAVVEKLLELLPLVKSWFPSLSISSDMLLVVVGPTIIQVQGNFDRLAFLQVRRVLPDPLDCKRADFCNIPCLVCLIFR